MRWLSDETCQYDAMTDKVDVTLSVGGVHGDIYSILVFVGAWALTDDYLL